MRSEKGLGRDGGAWGDATLFGAGGAPIGHNVVREISLPSETDTEPVRDSAGYGHQNHDHGPPSAISPFQQITSQCDRRTSQCYSDFTSLFYVNLIMFSSIFGHDYLLDSPYHGF